ncbi:uncharacterized protein LOC111262404 isoform X3 [Varroa jacobsoni]|uniref:uncharacterized protein LOC111262404 isoform X3 n=1 Tax=Varroa jacobsoni TaxID=62625 RepID=UPI000BFA23B9|nr:uncharacterized protein LOC111262404 isoform X3 [Varroa jacobsoni]
MAPLSKLNLKAGFGSTRNLGSRTSSNDFADFDALSCPNTFDDDPTVDEFFEQRQAKGLVAGIVGPLQQLPRSQASQEQQRKSQFPEKTKIPPRNQTIELRSISKSVVRIKSPAPISDPVLPNKERQGYFSSVNDLSSTQAKTADKHRTIAAALAESARKGIQRRSQSIREKIMFRRPPPEKPIPPEDQQAKNSASKELTPVTPLALLARPRTPPKTRLKRITRPGPATHGYRVIPQPRTLTQKVLKRHVLGRWSLPMASALVEEVDPDENDGKIDVTPLLTRPAHGKKKIIPAQNNNNLKKAPTPNSSMVRANSLVVLTPKRKKSLVKGIRIQFNHRVLAPFADSLRKLSLRKTIIAGKQPVLPSKKKPISSKTRNPYAHIKSKVGEVFRSVLPKRDAAPEKRPAKERLNMSKLNTTSGFSCANCSTVSVPSFSTVMAGASSIKKRVPSKLRQSPSITSPASAFGGNGSYRNPNPPGKTLAQLVKDFHRTPPRFRSQRTDTRFVKRTFI